MARQLGCHAMYKIVSWSIDYFSSQTIEQLIESFGSRAHQPLAGFEISNWMHLSIGQVDCKNHLSECAIHLSEINKANATYVKIRNTQSSVRQVLQVLISLVRLSFLLISDDRTSEISNPTLWSRCRAGIPIILPKLELVNIDWCHMCQCHQFAFWSDSKDLI